MNGLFKDWQWTRGKSVVVALILSAALVGFEIFNFDTTRFALMDLMSGNKFWGIEWATILAFAFCSIDFAGVIRIFTPEQSLKDEPEEVRMLMGAWFVGAILNALMTWYAMALLIAPRNVGATLVAQQDMLYFAPILVAVFVWLTRLLLIGSSSIATDRLLHGGSGRSPRPRRTQQRPVRSRQWTQPAVNGEENYEDEFAGY